MTSRLHRVFACLLLVLLPLQAMASVVMCPHAKPLPAAVETAAVSAMDHCARMAMQANGGGENQSNQSQPVEQNKNSCCSAASACAMFSMAINTQPPSRSVSNHEQPKPLASPQDISFIPEGLQRPPSIGA